jgi:hypothetical protein
MAEFGERATQLSPPQGAGASPIAPVTAGLMDNGVFKGIANIVDIFEKGLQNDAKAKAAAAEQAVVGGYAKKLQALNDAATSGQMKPSEVAARQRALHSEYVGGYSQYVDSLDKVSKSFKGTEIGAAEDKIKTEQELRKEAVSAAQKAGFPITEGMGEKTVQAMVDAHQTAVRTDAEFQRYTAKAAEERASGRYSQDVTDREYKQKSLMLVNEVANTNLSTASQYAMDIGERLRANKIDLNTANAEWATYTARIEAQIQSASGINPELAAPYRSLFADLKLTGAKLFDPKAELDVINNQINLIQARGKLAALGDPQVAAAVVGSQLLGTNADLALRASPVMLKAIDKLSKLDVNAPGYKPQVVGNPEVEKPTLDFIKDSIDRLGTGRYKDEPQAKTELTNTINNMLAQVGKEMGNNGADAKYLKNVADFVASTKYGKYASENPMDAKTLAMATKTFQTAYEGPVVASIDKKLTEAFVTNTGLVPNRAATGGTLQPTEKTFDRSNLKINFSGSGIYFDLAKTPTDPIERQNAQKTIQALKEAETGVNQLIRLGAHLEGSVNYAKYWEDNKHIILPRLFSKYEGLEIGQVVNGKTYMGGDARDATNWK